MPKFVDRDARRRLIVDALLRVADRDGLGAATSRAIAAELGVATSSLWHYFLNFDALLSAAFDMIISLSNERIKNRTAGLSGLNALRAMMAETLPLDPVTEAEARLVVSFWGRVAVISSLAASVRAVDVEWRAVLDERLREAILSREIVPEAPVESLVDLLMSIMSGQQVVSVTRGTVVDPVRQMNLIETVIHPYLTQIPANAEPGIA